MIPLTARQRRAIYRRDPVAFCQKAFKVLNNGAPLTPEWHHEAILSHILQNLPDQTTRLIVNAPPRSAKSLLVSIAFVAYTLARDPSHKFVCASYSGDLARALHADCRRLMESKWYRSITSTRLAKSTEDEIVTTRGGYRLATSVGATLTGLGGDTLIIDDALSSNEARSDTSRPQANEWLAGTALSRLNNTMTGKIILVMQRFHQADPTGYLLEKGGWLPLVLPAIAPCDLSIPIIPGTYKWKAGEPLQRVRQPLHALEDLKRQMGFEKFSAQYLQDPLPELGNLLKRTWLREYNTLTPHPNDLIVQSWDTAMKSTKGSNYSVCLTFVVRNSNQYFLWDVLRQKLEFPALVAAAKSQAQKFKPKAILIEDQTSGTSLIAQLRSDGLQGIIPIKSVKSKTQRMEGETAKLESGSLLLPESAHWLEDFLKEYLAFPNGKYDDQIDALSQFLSWQGSHQRTEFEFDFGHGDDGGRRHGATSLGAPSAEELCWLLGR